MNKFLRGMYHKEENTSYGTVFYNGFFKPYYSVGDFGRELLTPVVLPIICAVSELICIVQVGVHLLNVLTAMLSLKFYSKDDADDVETKLKVELAQDFFLLYNPEGLNISLRHTLAFFVGAIAAVVAAVILPILGAVALITRLGSTVHHGVTANEDAQVLTFN